MSDKLESLSDKLGVTHDIAQEALHQAKTARPFPHTSIMDAEEREKHDTKHRQDLQAHLTLHKNSLESERVVVKLQIQVASDFIQKWAAKAINERPIPPESVKIRLLSLEQAQDTLKVDVARLSFLSEQAKAVESAYHSYPVYVPKAGDKRFTVQDVTADLTQPKHKEE